MKTFPEFRKLVGDQLKLKDSISKVFGVSIKDRGAILSTCLKRHIVKYFF